MSMLRGLLLAAALASGAAPARADEIVVFAAASLKNALDAVAADWTAAGGHSATISYAASSALAKQIEEGAPAAVFISADLAWMDYLEERDLIAPDTRRNLLGNTLVLIGAAGAAPIEIAPGVDLVGALGDGRLAMADVAAVPAGKYGKAALESLGVWGGVADRLAQAENVRAALTLVSTGEAPLGIVYGSDAVADDAVTVVGTFPEDSHPPIVYPVAALKQHGDAATSLLDYLATPEAHEVFAEHGFTPLD